MDIRGPDNEHRHPAKKPMQPRTEVWLWYATNGYRLVWQATAASMCTLWHPITGEPDWKRAAHLESIGERVHSIPSGKKGDDE